MNKDNIFSLPGRQRELAEKEESGIFGRKKHTPQRVSYMQPDDTRSTSGISETHACDMTQIFYFLFSLLLANFPYPLEVPFLICSSWS